MIGMWFSICTYENTLSPGIPAVISLLPTSQVILSSNTSTQCIKKLASRLNLFISWHFSCLILSIEAVTASVNNSSVREKFMFNNP